ncbi:hypothetical protein F5Y06DRAFT_286321 [Hypoxylon sp. FL0890]|nr:hypothetical protein F5Y06DRAFT_286321 [Hypoxylon sp. FL0890]
MDDHVYLGTWTNWSRGPVLGRTLTTTKENGNLLIAFTAFFVAFVASRFWRIFCLIFHRWYSTSDPQDAIHHQRQITLRNSSTAESGLWSFVCIMYAWRRAPIKRLLCVLPPILLAVSSLVAFTIAGGYSATISTTMGDEVLIQSPSCGILPGRAESNIPDSVLSGNNAERLNNAANYAQQCYNTNSPGMLDCNRFVAKRLPTQTIDYNATCPFDESICRSTDSNIYLDTGYIDSNSHLGLNTPDGQRFAWRYVLHCAPLKTEGYVSHLVQQGTNKSFARPSTSVYFQGQLLDGSDFVPLPEVNASNGALTIVFLSGDGVLFSQIADDQWYRGIVPYRMVYDMGINGSSQTYRPEEAASPMGCVEKWQWCNPAYPPERGCGPLSDNIDAIYGAAPLFNMTVEDLAPERPSSPTAIGTQLVWSALIFLGNPQTIAFALLHLGAKSLISQSQLYGGVQFSLSQNQWQLDVIHWWNTILASIQASYIDTVLGYNDPEIDSSKWPPLNEEEQTMCKSQKIRSSAYTSFSLFGLYFTYVTGAVIIILSYVLEPSLAWLHRRRKYRQYEHLEWASNTSLQLYRLANESLGLGKWSDCTETVPITECGTHLACLDIADLNHPIFIHPADTIQVPTPEQVDQESDGEEADDHSDETAIGDITQSPISCMQAESDSSNTPQVTQDDASLHSTNPGSLVLAEGGHQNSPIQQVPANITANTTSIHRQNSPEPE